MGALASRPEPTPAGGAGRGMPAYLDHHATTPVEPRVLEAMRPYFDEAFGNPSSRSHPYGWEADEAVARARAQVAALVGGAAHEVFFTSGATESNQLALLGSVGFPPRPGSHVVTVATEHSSVLGVCRRLESAGVRVTRIPVGPDGLVDPARLAAAVTADTALVSVMWANNEVGVVQDIASIARLCADRGVPFHSDATQAAGWLAFDVRRTGVDLLSLSAHKLHGPKGVGALWIRGGTRSPRFAPWMDGGGQEGGVRPGTLNVPGIVGMGEACAMARESREADARRVAALRDRLSDLLLAAVPDAVVNGASAPRLPNNLSISFPGIDGERLMASLVEVAVSNGAACSSAARRPSHVLEAIGLPPELAQSTLRIGLGRGTTGAEVLLAAGHVARVVTALREGD